MTASWRNQFDGYRRVVISSHGRAPWHTRLAIYVGFALMLVLIAVILIPAIVLGLLFFLISIPLRAIKSAFRPREKPDAGRENVRVIRR
ncbi:MAG: hypothetical protein AAGI17_06965 [Planctomycetota bacterium]